MKMILMGVKFLKFKAFMGKDLEICILLDSLDVKSLLWFSDSLLKLLGNLVISLSGWLLLYPEIFIEFIVFGVSVW